ncbi:AcrR family transcriptional regulator [Agrobacterium vitis]|nr:AcrR family transcriptional regulator [Agrobacterium vitis]MBE1439693.1 AcrR family transcriptional regulator [Agrobacterium vitis]
MEQDININAETDPDLGTARRCAPGSGRFAAGADPAKRDQILEGARRAFMKYGFDATSMNHITREAGVSKGTIYVYFENKEDLFSALIQTSKQKFTATLRDILAEDGDVRDILRNYGKAFARYILTSQMTEAIRILLGVIDRMPHLCSNFMKSGPENARSVLEEFLQKQVDAQRLEIDNVELAARQFVELTTGTFFKERLFGNPAPLDLEKTIDTVVDSALHMFLLAYERK